MADCGQRTSIDRNAGSPAFPSTRCHSARIADEEVIEQVGDKRGKEYAADHRTRNDGIKVARARCCGAQTAERLRRYDLEDQGRAGATITDVGEEDSPQLAGVHRSDEEVKTIGEIGERAGGTIRAPGNSRGKECLTSEPGHNSVAYHRDEVVSRFDAQRGTDKKEPAQCLPSQGHSASRMRSAALRCRGRSAGLRVVEESAT